MKKLILIAVCLVVTAGSAYTLWPKGGRVTPEMGYRPRVCDACGHPHDGPSEPVVTECPKCKKREGVRAHYYDCQACGERFEAYRERLADASIVEMDPMTPPKFVYKLKGGEWKKTIQALGTLTCPKCKSPKVKAPPPQ